MRRKGFTLIELLVVIAIIAILAAILFPVFTSAKQRAQQQKCMNNMSQVGKAMVMYADDYQGSLPCPFNTEGDWGDWSRTWRERLWKNKYLTSKKALLCACKNIKPDGRVFDGHSHYGMVIYLFHKTGAKSEAVQGNYYRVCPISSIPLPTKTFLLGENNNGDWDVKPMTEDGSSVGSGGFWAYHGDRQNPGGVFLMCDTHAKFMTIKAAEEPVNGITWFWWKKNKINI